MYKAIQTFVKQMGKLGEKTSSWCPLRMNFKSLCYFPSSISKAKLQDAVNLRLWSGSKMFSVPCSKRFVAV